MWRRIYQRKLLFWIGMYLSIAFGSALQGFTQHQPIYVWTANVVFSLLIVFLWHKFSGYIQEVRGHSLQDKLILVFLFALSNVMLACSAWQSLGYLWLLPVIMVSIGSGIEQFHGLEGGVALDGNFLSLEALPVPVRHEVQCRLF